MSLGNIRVVDKGTHMDLVDNMAMEDSTLEDKLVETPPTPFSYNKVVGNREAE